MIGFLLLDKILPSAQRATRTDFFERMCLPALMQFDHIMIGIPHKDGLRVWPKAYRAAAQSDTGIVECLPGGNKIGTKERKMGDARVFFWHVHQDIGFIGFSGVDDQVDLRA
jgi:hypothetical protein